MTTRAVTLACTLTLAFQVEAAVQYSGTASFGYWSSNRNLDDSRGGAVATLQQKVMLDVDPIRIQADLLVTTRDREDHFGADVRELYAQYKTPDLVLRVGRQVINWGAADLVNPTQRFSTNNFRLRSSQPGLQQGGVDAMRVIKSFDNLNVDVVASTFYQGSRLPLGPLQQVGLLTSDRGGRTHPAFGIRISNTDTMHEYSVSYFRGDDTMPVYGINSLATAIPIHPRIEVLGADYAYSLGDYALKLEGAVAKNLNKSETPFPLDQLHIVVGVERRIADYTLSALYSQKSIPDFNHDLLHDPLTRFNLNALDQLSKNPRDLFVRITKVAEDLGGSFTVIARKSLVDSSGAVIFSYEKSLRDGVILAFGFDRFFGEERSYSGALRPNDSGYAVIRLSF
jgi:hypothetical protein